MKILMLTWEFPPAITGGLGMACYGMAKALLGQGTQVDLVIPAKEEVYLSLKNPDDADNLQSNLVDPSKQQGLQGKLSPERLRELITNPVSAYFRVPETTRQIHTFKAIQHSKPIDRLCEILEDESYLFRQVRDYTAMAVNIGSTLDFDVIHAHDWLTYPAAIILKKLSGKPLVAHVHATEFDRAGGVGDGRIHNIEYMGIECADRVIAVSGYTANTIMQKYHIAEDKLKVVHNAYSLTDSPGNQRRIFKEPTVLFMGRITLQKGPDYFLEVARRVLQHEQKVRFVMAGSGDMERHILHKAAALGLGTKFLVAGFLERHEVEKILSSADIFVLPSVSEPFGIAPLEAMSHGAVAIISKNAGVAEIIEYAYKIDFWDIDQMTSTILELIRNPAKFQQMSKHSKEEVANLRWEEAVSKLVEIFNELEEAQKCSV